jgi:hypothetical protein
MTAAEAERLYQAVVLLRDSGDITPTGARVIQAIVTQATW